MQDQVSKVFAGQTDAQAIFEVAEGKPLEVLLDQIVKKDIDLVVIGRKKAAKDTRRLPINLARKAPCSVLIVPEESDTAPSNILIPVDFSEFCKDALTQAIQLALANNISTLHILHVFKLPLGYYKTGNSQEEFTEIMRGNAKKDYEKFVSQIDLKGLRLAPIFIRHDKPSQVIEQVIEEKKIDLIVLGTRGRNAGAGLLLGSITEDVILNTRVPIMAVKQKGTGLLILEVLLKYV